MSMPLQLVTSDVCEDVRKTKRMYPSILDEDRLIFDNENEVVDPALVIISIKLNRLHLNWRNMLILRRNK